MIVGANGSGSTTTSAAPIGGGGGTKIGVSRNFPPGAINRGTGKSNMLSLSLNAGDIMNNSRQSNISQISGGGISVAHEKSTSQSLASQ